MRGKAKTERGNYVTSVWLWICHGRYVFFLSRVRDHLGEIPFSSGFLAVLYVLCSACIKPSQKTTISIHSNLHNNYRGEKKRRSVRSYWFLAMVASADTDIYSPFQQPMISEDGPQSSEEGSGLHSPVFGAPYPTHNDNCMFCPIIVFNPWLTYFVIKSGINIINLTFTTPRLWWCRNMTMDIVWILNSRRCFTQYNNHRVQTPDMSHSLTTISLLATTLGLSSLLKALGSLQFRMSRPLTSDTPQSDGYLVRHPMTILIPEHLEFQWIMIMVITGPLLWTPFHIQKPLLLLLNRVHHPKTLARRHRLLS